MKTIYCFLTFAALAIAQPTGLRVDGVTPTQAVISYVPPSASACTISTSPAADDVNNTLFSGSNSDASRATTLGNRRYFILGTRAAQLASDGRMHSRALAADTAYSVSVTCGSAASASFTTAKISGLVPEPAPFNTDGFGNYGFPEYDLTSRETPIIDPQTGTKSYMIASPKDYAHVGAYSFPSGIYFGGTGWTNPGNITAASTLTLATTSNTNPIVVPFNLDDAIIYGQHQTIDLNGILTDAAVDIYGSGTDGTAGNRQVKACLTVDSQTCYTPQITLQLTTSATHVGVSPAEFPTAGAANATWYPFKGWGKTIPRYYIARGGSTNVSSGVMTVTDGGYAWSLFSAEWAAGSKVYIAGSSPTCASNYCTIASVQTSRQLTLVENLTISAAQWRFAGVGVRFEKTNATGSVSISASYKVAKSYPIGAGAEPSCSPTTVTTNVDRDGNPISPGIVGRLCAFETYDASRYGIVYFVGESQPEFRLISLGRFHSAPMGYDSSQDWVYTPVLRMKSGQTIFDPNDANIWYTVTGVNDGSNDPAIFKGTYTGDYRENSALFFSAGNDTGVYSYVDDSVTWVNLTRKSLGQDIRSRILAGTSYSESMYPTIIASNLTFAGIVNGTIVFNVLSGSQNQAGWVFTFNASTGALQQAFNTAVGPKTGYRFAGIHSVGTGAGKAMVSYHNLDESPNASVAYGGPFVLNPTHVYKSGVANSNTSLPSSFDGTYDMACDADIAQEFKDAGATGNNCVRMKFATEPCSSYATSAEKAATPCPGDATKSYIGVAMAPGDEMFDATGADNEHLLLVKRTNLTGNTWEGQFLRNAGESYCCYPDNNRNADRCVQSIGQMAHLNGATWVAASRGSCSYGVQLYTPTDVTDAVHEVHNFTRGHFAYTTTTGGINFLGIGGGYAGRYNVTSADLGQYDAWKQTYAYTFDAATLSISYTQSYANPGFAGVGMDWRHPNPSVGTSPEASGQELGATLTVALVSGQSYTYKVTGYTAPDSIKVQQFMNWMAWHNFGDMSSASTGNLITDANLWRYCYAYRVNECRTGSSVGDLYIVAPGIDTTNFTNCNSSQVTRNALCIVPSGPGLANMVQLDATGSDTSGTKARRIGMNNTPPGAQYTYSHLNPEGPTKPTWGLANQYLQNTIWNGGALVDPGGMPSTSRPAGQFVQSPVSVRAISGANQVRVRFGYAEYGTVGTNFYCTSRAEDCVTDASLSPYAFVGDSLTPTTCTSGTCTVYIPAIPGRVLVYRVERLNSGSVVSTGALEFKAIQ